MDFKKRLLEKGWNKKEIDKAAKIIERAKAKKHPKIKILDKIVVWLSFIVAVMGNFMISLFMVPFLVFLNKSMLYFIAIIIGLAFGFLFELLIRSIRHFEAKRRILFLTVVPLIAVINFALINLVANNISKIFGVGYFQITQNTVIIGIVYTLAFISPYMFYQFLVKK